jgi:hypothetical protein
MDVGMMMIFAAYGWENIGDDQVWDEELRLARQAADLGFNVLWSADGCEAPTMLIADFCISWPKLEESEELARKHMGSLVHSNFEHYELLCDHFNTVKGYGAYAQKAAIAEAAGMDGAIADFMKAVVWGTPDRTLRELESRRAVIGEFELDTGFRFGGIPHDTAEKSLRLFAKEALPVLQSWTAETIASAAAA